MLFIRLFGIICIKKYLNIFVYSGISLRQCILAIIIRVKLLNRRFNGRKKTDYMYEKSGLCFNLHIFAI